MATDPPKAKYRQAVVVVHGMGDKKPTDTLRRAIAAIVPPRTESGPDPYPPGVEEYEKNRNPHFYTLPDRLSGHLDQRFFISLRHPHPEAPQGIDPPRSVASSERYPQTDVFEYHWAHLFTGNRWFDILWIWRRFLRPRRSTWMAWLFAWVTLVLSALAIWRAILFGTGPKFSLIEVWNANRVDAVLTVALAVVVVAPIVAFLGNLLVKDIADVARYLSLSPRNLATRREIHNGLADMLGRLHEEGRYQRVIVVAHSLGSYIAYDALSGLWADLAQLHANKAPDKGVSHQEEIQPALLALELTSYRIVLASLRKLTRKPNGTELAVDDTTQEQELCKLRERFRGEQFEFWKEQRRRGNPWLVTDFVSLGSPMKFAHVLAARGLADLRRRQSWREMPTCPPWREGPPRELWWRNPHQYRDLKYPLSCDGKLRHCSACKKNDSHLEPGYWFSWLNGYNRVPNQAAVFSATRWTNIYFRSDPFAGPLSRNFGDGIDDRELPWLGGGRFSWVPVLSHTKYFTLGRKKRRTKAVQELRDAIDLHAGVDLHDSYAAPRIHPSTEVVSRQGRPPQQFERRPTLPRRDFPIPTQNRDRSEDTSGHS